MTTGADADSAGGTTAPAGTTPPPPSPPPRSRPGLTLTLVVCAAIGGGAAGVAGQRLFAGASAAPSAADARGEPVAIPALAVVRATRATVGHQEVFTGEFRPFDEVELRPEVAGFLTSISVDEGDRVAAGETLAVLEVPGLDDDIARAGAQIDRDEAAADTAAANRANDHQIWQRISAVASAQEHLVAQQDIDDAKQRDDAAEAAWQAALGQVKISKAEHQRLLTLAGFRTITAPFAGTVTARYADPGTLVQGGVSPGAASPALIRLSRNDLLRLSFPVVESLVPRIAVGSPLTISIGALERTFAGTVARFTRKLDLSTRTMEVEADIPNPDLSIVPGMFADVAFTAERHADVVALPPQTLRRRAQSVSVFVVGPDHRIEERPVTLGLEGPDLVEIAAGVKPGEEVVFGKLDEARAGMLVEPRLLADAPGASP